MTKHIKGKGLWVLAAVLLIGAALVTTGVYAAGITVKAQPLQNTGANGKITYSPTYSNAAAVVTRDESSTLTLNGSDQVTSVTVGGTKASGGANVKVDLLDNSATVLDTVTVALPSAAGTYSTIATLTSGTIPYRQAAKVAATYTATSVPIAFDAASSATGTTAALTWSHTVGSGNNRILVVGVSTRNMSGPTGVTYAAQALTRLGFQNDPDNATRVEIWYKVAPLAGINNIVVTFAASSKVVGGATSWAEVHQTTPFGTAAFASGQSLAPTVSVASAANQVVVDVLSTDGGVPTVGAGQTQRWNLAAGTLKAAGSSEPGAATVAMTWSIGTSNFWAIGAAPLKPAAP